MTGASMTAAQAAAALGIALDASAHDVDRAYRLRARAVHPDRLAGAAQARILAGAEEFSRLTLAHDIMLAVVAERPVEGILEDDDEPAPTPPQAARWLIVGWLIVLFCGGVVSYFGGALPLNHADVLLRLLPLAASATAFALTGRRGFYAAALALTVASAAITLAFASFGSLLALALLIVPVGGLLAVGRRVRRGS